MLEQSAAIEQMNKLGSNRIPFFFFTDFLATQTWIKPLDEITPDELQFEITDQLSGGHSDRPFTFSKNPPARSVFNASFERVVNAINYGNSYLVNLTFQTPIQTNLSLQEIYNLSRAKYKLRYTDRFVVFSPETFVKIRDGRIFSYPMKGTIDAGIPEAEQKILQDPKEMAEHVTIVDLIRNDLSQIATNVTVTKFRFISEVKTHEKKLLQVSSEIRGNLPENYLNELGTLFYKLLPAGSISGAPKKQTIQIIEEAEHYNRQFYTGVCGVFDGENLDSGVMIRFVENQEGQLVYKSGGGITSFSIADKEYQEIIDKVYLPIH
ncbi:MAG: aminodeoxychorismate synthase component I [Marinoscillum sp.]